MLLLLALDLAAVSLSKILQVGEKLGRIRAEKRVSSDSKLT